jgi:hypothetical protein
VKKVLFYPIPRSFVESCIETIRTWCRIAPHFLDDGVDFTEIRGGAGERGRIWVGQVGGLCERVLLGAVVWGGRIGPGGSG